MNDVKYPRDLVVLVADKNMEYSIKSILERPQSLGIKKLDFIIYPHPKRDPGCLVSSHYYLLREVNKFQHALVMFDREGCGREHKTRTELENEIEERLSSSGWGNRAAAIIIDPELENWVWSDSPELDAAIGWQGMSTPLRSWLKEKNFLADNSLKPYPPKKAFEDALKKVRKPRSSSIYKQIADRVSLKRCQDPAFLKLKEKLHQWFAVHKTGVNGFKPGR